MNPFIALSLILVCCNAFAQQENTISSYTQNLVTVNPAFAGIKKQLVASLLYNKQFPGFEEYTEQQNFTLHTPVNHYRFGIGAYMYSIKQNFYKISVYSACFSYKIKMHKGYLSAGTGAGMYQINADILSLRIKDLSDPTLTQAMYTARSADLSAGLLYSDPSWTVGVSGLHLMPGIKSGQYLNMNTHYNMIICKKIRLTNTSALLPSTLVRYTHLHPLTADVSMFYLYKENIRTGISYRTSGILSLQACINMSVLIPSFPHAIFVAYAYDYNITAVRRHIQNSHEIMFIGEFSILRKPGKSKPVVSPLLF